MSLQSELKAELLRRQKEQAKQKLRAAISRMNRDELIDSLMEAVTQYERIKNANQHYRVMLQELVNQMSPEGIKRAFFDG